MIYLLFTPASGLPKTGLQNIPHSDKIIHAGMFCILSFVFLFDSDKTGANLFKRTVLFLILCIAFGIFTEYIQHAYIPGRHGNVFDIVADATGSIIGIGFYFIIGRKILSSFL